MNTVRVCCFVLVLVASITANGLDPETTNYVKSVINDPRSTSLIILKHIGVEGARTIAHLLTTEEFRKTKITHLLLHSNSIRDKGVTAIAQSLPGTRITHVDLGANEITSTGAVAIASVLKRTPITHLNFFKNYLGPDGLAPIIQALVGSKVTFLDIGSNDIGDESLEGVGEILENTEIKILKLKSNRVGSAGIKSMLPGLKKLTHLYLEGNMAGDEGAGIIATALKDSRLWFLNLSGNSLTDIGALAIATELKDSRLINLFIEDNQIGKLGLESIAAVLPDTLITYLTFDDKVKLDSDVYEKMISDITRNVKIVDEIYSRFVKFVRSDEQGQLEFVLNKDYPPLNYIVFVEVISRNKQGWIGHFIGKNEGRYADLLEDFVNKIEFNLAKFSSELKIELIDRIKLLLECEKRGLKEVFVNVLMSQYELRPKDENKPHPLDGVLHPAIYILMEEHGRSWFPRRAKPVKGRDLKLLKDLGGIFNTGKWDGLIKEKQLGEIGKGYGKKQVMEIIKRKSIEYSN